MQLSYQVAAAQVAYTYQRLGGDILDIEIKADNVYNHYEEAVLEYSYIVNLHQARNALGSALGGATGSFNNKGEVTSGTSVSLKYPKFILIMLSVLLISFQLNQSIVGSELRGSILHLLILLQIKQIMTYKRS